MTHAAPTRELVRTWIEEATGAGLSVDDALPDSLAAVCDAEGISAAVLHMWIFDHGGVNDAGDYAGTIQTVATWTPASLVEWAKRYGLTGSTEGLRPLPRHERAD